MGVLLPILVKDTKIMVNRADNDLNNQCRIAELKRLWKGILKKASQPKVGLLAGDPAGIRTQDHYIKSVMLYQLSYGIRYF